ncbi:MAG: hypothetical protein KVP17_002500, partial [Porospora cf. gigantea B]
MVPIWQKLKEMLPVLEPRLNEFIHHYNAEGHVFVTTQMLAEESRTALQCIEFDQEKTQKHASKNEGIRKRMLKYASLLPMPTVKESAPPGATVTAKQMSLLFAVILYLSSAIPITDQQRLISDLFIMLFTDGTVTILRCPGCLRIGKTVKLALKPCSFTLSCSGARCPFTYGPSRYNCYHSAPAQYIVLPQSLLPPGISIPTQDVAGNQYTTTEAHATIHRKRPPPSPEHKAPKALCGEQQHRVEVPIPETAKKTSPKAHSREEPPIWPSRAATKKESTAGKPPKTTPLDKARSRHQKRMRALASTVVLRRIDIPTISQLLESSSTEHSEEEPTAAETALENIDGDCDSDTPMEGSDRCSTPPKRTLTEHHIHGVMLGDWDETDAEKLGQMVIKNVLPRWEALWGRRLECTEERIDKLETSHTASENRISRIGASLEQVKTELNTLKTKASSAVEIGPLPTPRPDPIWPKTDYPDITDIYLQLDVMGRNRVRLRARFCGIDPRLGPLLLDIWS